MQETGDISSEMSSEVNSEVSGEHTIACARVHSSTGFRIERRREDRYFDRTETHQYKTESGPRQDRTETLQDKIRQYSAVQDSTDLISP